jgi:hypothetical protein
MVALIYLQYSGIRIMSIRRHQCQQRIRVVPFDITPGCRVPMLAATTLSHKKQKEGSKLRKGQSECNHPIPKGVVPSTNRSDSCEATSNGSWLTLIVHLYIERIGLQILWGTHITRNNLLRGFAKERKSHHSQETCGTREWKTEWCPWEGFDLLA